MVIVLTLKGGIFMKMVETEGLTFDDVLIVPKYTEVSSRHDPDISARIGKYEFKIPIIGAPMDLVCGPEMCIKLGELGGLGVLHRFMTIEDQVRAAQQIKDTGTTVACAVGTKDLAERAKELAKLTDIFLIDIANGYTRIMRDAVEYMKSEFRQPLMAGNIATRAAAANYAEWGVDVYRVGIGSGRFCQTRSVTGVGVPQLTVIDEVRKGAQGRIIIADGGIRGSSDVAKAIAAGANFVMLGNLISGTTETPGPIKDDGHGKYKDCRGMASREVNEENGNGKYVAPEGITVKVSYKGPVEEIIRPLVMGLRSAFTYVNARNIEEFQENAVFMKISAAGRYESADRRTRDS